MNAWKPAIPTKDLPPAKTRDVSFTALAEHAIQIAMINGGLTCEQIKAEARRLIESNELPFISLGGNPIINIKYTENEWIHKTQILITARIIWGWQSSDFSKPSYTAKFEEDKIELKKLPQTLISAYQRKIDTGALVSSDLIDIRDMPGIEITSINEKERAFDIKTNAWPKPRSWNAVFRKLKRMEKERD